MKLSNLMVIKAIVCLVFGILLVLVPAILLSLYGVTLGPGGVFMARLYGASLVGNLMLSWFARNAVDSEARQAIVLDLFVYDAIGFVVALLAQLSGLMNPLGWSIVVIYLFLTLGFGYFQIAKPSAS
ncbi:MAG: hypothetical protein MUP04_07405 [Anaerolineae bacterium]|nr:hypothetical protein [Anaerolineae bacterium]